MIGALIAAAMDPVVAGYVAAVLVGKPTLGHELAHTCWREAPRCQLRGEHEHDAWASARVWRAAMARGWLDSGCRWHAPTDGRNFSTSGPWGAMRAYTWHHLADEIGRPCVPLTVLDVPLVGALAVALRMREACERHNACDRDRIRKVWRGIGRRP